MPKTPPATATGLDDLLALVAQLRAPDGCPWDRKQGFAELRSYLLEEAHEVAAAIDAQDLNELADELGDLLFQIAFIGRLAEEAGAFRLRDSIDRVHRKMIERHPHVFGDSPPLTQASDVAKAWERRKVERRPERDSILDGIATSLPDLVAAYRLTQKAAGVGFDWPNAERVLDKLDEEAGELRQAIADHAATGDREGLSEELGDLLFTVVNLARKLDIDPGSALARTNLKFRRRFHHIEQRLRQQERTLNDADLAEMEALWEEAKTKARPATPATPRPAPSDRAASKH